MSTQTKKEIFCRNIEKVRQAQCQRRATEMKRGWLFRPIDLGIDSIEIGGVRYGATAKVYEAKNV